VTSYLSGSKKYTAGVELGFETTTLDMEGEVTKRAPYDHVTVEQVQEALSEFVGTIDQIPPIFSAIRKDGKRLFEKARSGVSADDIEIEPRQVHIYSVDLVPSMLELPKFAINVECGGGTYVRSLVRDIAYKVGTVGTTTFLERTKQGQFTLDDAIPKDDWTADNIYAAIDHFNQQLNEDES